MYGDIALLLIATTESFLIEILHSILNSRRGLTEGGGRPRGGGVFNQTPRTPLAHRPVIRSI